MHISKILANLGSFFQKREVIIVSLIFLFALAIRFYNLTDNIIFAYDQGRDAQRVWDIVMNGDIKIVGPETDIPGVFNGPLFYYILAPIYFFSNFDPNAAAAFFVVLNASGVILLYLTAKILFKDPRVGYIAGILWAVSYQQLNFARFISNASPMSIASMVFFLGLAMYIFKKKNSGLIISAIGLGAATHFNFYLIYLGIFYPIFYLIYTPKIHKKTLTISISVLFLILSPWLIAELVWDFSAIKAFTEYFGHQSASFSVIENFERYLDRTSEMSYFSFFSFNLTIAFLLTVSMIYMIKNAGKKDNSTRFLFLWAFSTAPLFSFSSGVLSGSVINSSIFAPFTLIWAAGIAILLKNKNMKYLGYVLIALVLIFNFHLMYKDGFQNVRIFAMQRIFLGDEKKAINYTYSESKGKPFSICGVTNPLFVNSLWSHLYKTYGESEYGYLPFWAGTEQDRNINHLPYDISRAELRYLIIEPMGGIPENARKSFIYNEDHITDLLDEQQFGETVVQKRKLKSEKSFTDTQNLTPYDISILNAINKVDSRYTCNVQYNNVQ